MAASSAARGDLPFTEKSFYLSEFRDRTLAIAASFQPLAAISAIEPVLAELSELGVRTSLFMDPDPAQIAAAADLGADRIELYTEAYARAFGGSQETACFEVYRAAADRARKGGLGINAGHDLNLENLRRFLTIPDVLEVSIGHALMADALFMGLAAAVRAYLEITSGKNTGGGA